jgi:hypothetical protein
MQGPIRISWQGAAVVLVLVAGAVLAGLYGPLELATALGAGALGFLTRFGALGR